MLGRFIDEKLTDVERDRIISHTGGWEAGCSSWPDGARCFLGAALAAADAGGEDVRRAVYGDPRWTHDITKRFDALCYHFGPDRIGRAIKLRASKANRVTLPEPEKATAA